MHYEHCELYNKLVNMYCKSCIIIIIEATLKMYASALRNKISKQVLSFLKINSTSALVNH